MSHYTFLLDLQWQCIPSHLVAIWTQEFSFDLLLPSSVAVFIPTFSTIHLFFSVTVNENLPRNMVHLDSTPNQIIPKL